MWSSLSCRDALTCADFNGAGRILCHLRECEAGAMHQPPCVGSAGVLARHHHGRVCCVHPRQKTAYHVSESSTRTTSTNCITYYATDPSSRCVYSIALHRVSIPKRAAPERSRLWNADFKGESYQSLPDTTHGAVPTPAPLTASTTLVGMSVCVRVDVYARL